MTLSTQFNIRLDDELAQQLEEVAAALGRDRTWVAREALKRYLEIERSHIEAVKEGIAAAERGEFASEAEMERIFNRYRNAG